MSWCHLESRPSIICYPTLLGIRYILLAMAVVTTSSVAGNRKSKIKKESAMGSPFSADEIDPSLSPRNECVAAVRSCDNNSNSCFPHTIRDWYYGPVLKYNVLYYVLSLLDT